MGFSDFRYLFKTTNTIRKIVIRKDIKKNCNSDKKVTIFLLPNQGSNLDFTDPESVVLPITPLGISDRKITHNFYSCDKNFVFFLSCW